MRPNLFLGLALAVVLTATATAQQPAQPLPPVPYPVPLYRMDDVGKAITLTPQQVNRLNQVTDQAQARFREGYEKLGTLPPAERTMRMWDLERQYVTDWNKAARDVFNENQFNRYQQLRYQHGGFATLTDPEVQKRLQLTDAQRQALNESVEWSQKQMADITRLGALERERATKMYRDYQTQYNERFKRYLTPEQQRLWGEMTGEPFQFQPYIVPPG
jgi:hypothetical protein